VADPLLLFSMELRQFLWGTGMDDLSYFPEMMLAFGMLALLSFFWAEYLMSRAPRHPVSQIKVVSVCTTFFVCATGMFITSIEWMEELLSHQS